jgi:D-arabinose 1-dehydrogenase-like Zn-dependent alcohol dehydrogenase
MMWLTVGYAITDQKKYLDFQLKKYELESLQDDRITVAVEVCGVCGSVHLSTYYYLSIYGISPPL